MENRSVKKIFYFRYFVLYFFIYAFIGWLLETIYALGTLGHFVKRGFLYGPLCPIYGWGAIILISFLSKYKTNHKKLFFYSAIVFSVFEYVASFALEALFIDKWWDYTNDFMNLNGRISIFYSFAWGIIALVFINHIHPFVEKKLRKVLKKIPNTSQLISLNVISILYIIDSIFSCVKYLM